MPKLIRLVFFLLLFPFVNSAQVKPIGTWEIFLSYAQVKQVVQAGSRIYCASDQALFYFDKSDNSIQRMSRLNGLNDVGINFIDVSRQQNVVMVFYTNSNIDLVYNDHVVNISDIKRRSTTGDKTIYGVSFRNQFAYLATGFGVVVIDLARNEIKDSYIIGPGGAETIVYGIANDDSYIYASTNAGILRGSFSSANLSDFSQWSNVLAGMSQTDIYNKLACLDGKLIINIAYNYNQSSQKDSILLLDLISLNQLGMLNNGAYVTRSLRVVNNKLYITNYFSVLEWKNDLQTLLRAVYASTSYWTIDPFDAVSDDENIIWIADKKNGLVKWTDSTHVDYIVPDGPPYGQTSSIYNSGEALLVTHGPAHWGDAFLPYGFSIYKYNSWRAYNQYDYPDSKVDLSKINDNESIIADPSDPSHIWVGSYTHGLLELKNYQPDTFYNAFNSPLEVAIGNAPQVKVAGLDYDKEGNLWVVNSGVMNQLHRIKPDGTWNKFSFGSQVLGGNLFFGDVVADSYGYVWTIFVSAGIVGFNSANNQVVRVLNETGKGSLPALDVRSIAEDREGQLWIGTSKGVAVLYSPSSVFSGGSFDAQQILITQNGLNQYLLNYEIVSAIAVDGANRKWFGTAGGGLFLTSADGTQQLQTFNKDNSPLLSNNITGLTINPKTGELFIATDLGIMSYQSDAIEGTENCGEVTVYPNPVKESYSGPIAIKGVIENSKIKITDVSGNLVYETTALGGQAIWYAQNFEGKRVQTGVYMVYSMVSDDEGVHSCVTKVLVVN